MNLQSISTTISEANQTAVPSQVRRMLTLKPGDKLVWQTYPGKKQVVLTHLPQKLGSYLRGLGSEIWEKTDADAYLRNLRKDRA